MFIRLVGCPNFQICKASILGEYIFFYFIFDLNYFLLNNLLSVFRTSKTITLT